MTAKTLKRFRQKNEKKTKGGFFALYWSATKIFLPPSKLIFHGFAAENSDRLTEISTKSIFTTYILSKKILGWVRLLRRLKKQNFTPPPPKKKKCNGHLGRENEVAWSSSIKCREVGGEGWKMGSRVCVWREDGHSDGYSYQEG